MERTLQLNADYTPLKVLPWARAVELVLDQKAVTVTAYPGRFVRSPSLAIPWPAVIALRRYTATRARVKFRPAAVKARDHYTCLFCGLQPRLSSGRPDTGALTLDHVVPRAQAKSGAVFLPWSRRWVNVTCWENAATSCRSCNARKGDRTPLQAGMALRSIPRVPTSADVFRMALTRVSDVPEEWRPYLPEGCAPIGDADDSDAAASASRTPR